MLKTTVKKVEKQYIVSNYKKTLIEKLIHLKEKHVFGAKDQNSKIKLYTVFWFTSEFYS